MDNQYEIRGDTTAIFVKRPDGSFIETIVDTVDLQKMDSFHGSLVASRHDIYCPYYITGIIEIYSEKLDRVIKRRVSLHRFLMNFPEGLVVDHKNEDTLNNKRSTNLQAITNGENVRKSQKSKRFVAKRRFEKSHISCHITTDQKKEIMKRSAALGMSHEYWVSMILARELGSHPWYEVADQLANKRREAQGERAYRIQQKVDLSGGAANVGRVSNE